MTGSEPSRRDGTIIRCEPCTLQPLTYTQDTERFKAYYESERETALTQGLNPLPFHQRFAIPEPEWNAMRMHDGFECRALRYLSGGLEIDGFLYGPVRTAGRSLPLVILNRGGNRKFSEWTPWGFVQAAYPFGQAGFVVMASQYRGGGDSEGRDEFGGADVDDVLNLLPAARSLGYADLNNVFMLGVRGAG